MKKILVIDDDRDIRLLLSRFLSKNGYEVIEAGDCKRAAEAIRAHHPDLILTDFKLPDGDGLEISKEAMRVLPGVPIIMITAYSDVKMAVKAVKRGIFDYITKPLHPDELLETIERALSSKPIAHPNVSTPKAVKDRKKTSDEKTYVIGESKSAREVMAQIDIVAPTGLAVVILGETGTGKEYAAREIHQKSDRAGGPFVALDCGALSDEIAGSELFGHVKGAFTGAVGDKTGSFEYANGGTIFLDEIGNLDMQHQIMLLRVLQESAVKKIGSNKETPLDVRVVVATNENLHKRIEDGGFRQDLWYRLNEFTVALPPLRERVEDIPIFIDHFLSLSNASLGKQVEEVAPDAMRHLQEYRWPGNLRELKNVIKRAVLLSQDKAITDNVLPTDIKMPSSYFLRQSQESGGLKSASLQAEQDLIVDALRKTGNNKSKAAELLNIDRKTLYNKLKKLDLDQT